jgi:two-component system LytT family response regulator
MKVVLVEDERLSLIALEGTIKHFCPELEIVGTATSIKTALQVIPKVNPELVFLDIQLSDGTSFEILKALQEYHFKVVFLTAFSQYALQAFEYAAIHYLLKPINAKKLREVVNRLQLIPVKEYALNKNLSVLENLLGTRQNRLLVNTKKEVLFIDIDTIIYFEASSN